MPRRSNVSQAGTGEENTPAKEKVDGVNIEDLSLPRTMVQRLAKGVLPPNTQIQKDAIVAMSKGATVFINHIADKANELALSTNKKTITPQNVLEALSQCEYEDFLPRVKAELERFNEIATGKRNEYRRKIKEKETGTSTNGGEKKNVNLNGSVGNGNGEVGMDDGGEDEGEERARKRVRREEGLSEGIEKENGQRQMKPARRNGTREEDDEERYDTAMEDEGAGVEVPEGDAAQEDDTELSDDEVEEDEEGEVSQMDVGSGLDGRPDGLSSGVDDEDDEESD
ncbi:MAG: hypothetical protein L6R38_002424 [Xanthoria sp. 2 TBL-2021]|nr:MAG: hypothetical protein L6R38_002424 [Xanthoria sp. 2 TBL-2021]